MKKQSAKDKLAAFKNAVKKHQVKWETMQNGLIWKPEMEGEEIFGIATARNVIDTKYGLAPQIELRDNDKVYLLLSSKAGLRVLNRVPLGTPCKVKYEGTRRIKGRKTLMDVFDVQCPAGTTLENDWATQYYKKERGAARKTAKKAASKRR